MGWQWRRVVCSVAAAASTSVFAATGAAEEGAVEGEGVSSAVSAPAASTSAEALRERAKASYVQGQYAEALELLERANAAAPYELHQFNLGAVHDRMGHCEQARDHFEAFLRRIPRTETPAEGEARHALDELYEICGRAQDNEGDAALATPAEPSEPKVGVAPSVLAPHDDSSIPVIPALAVGSMTAESSPGVDEGRAGGLNWRGKLGVCLLGGAAAAGIAAAIAGIRVEDAEDDIRGLALRARDENTPASAGELGALNASGRRYQALSVGLGVASAVLAGAGATLLVLDLTDDSALEAASAGNPGLTYLKRF